MCQESGLKKPQPPSIYGSNEAIHNMIPTYNMGGVSEPSTDELSEMQNSSYILHAKEGTLSKIPAEKTLLPRDPKGSLQSIHAVMDNDETVYFSQATILSKSTDGGRTWNSHELGLGASPNCSFQVLRNHTFIGAKAENPENPAVVTISTSINEGRSWEKLSEVDNPAHCPDRYADTICRLPDDTLLLPLESRFPWNQDPNYVHRSTDGGKTWSGPTGPYSEPVFMNTHWVGPNTGPGFLGACCYETMIAPMASGKLLAVIRYHGPVVPQWPLISTGRHPTYKTIFLADSNDKGETWENFRPLTNVHGQCHGFGVGLNDGSVVVTHDHRYIPGTPSGKAIISRDEGETWENEVYYPYFSSDPRGRSGFSESVVLNDNTILTIAATTAKDLLNSPVGHTDVWAIRWKLV